MRSGFTVPDVPWEGWESSEVTLERTLSGGDMLVVCVCGVCVVGGSMRGWGKARIYQARARC